MAAHAERPSQTKTKSAQKSGAERKKIVNETSTEVWQPGHLSPHRLNYNESRVATQEYAAKNEIA